MEDSIWPTPLGEFRESVAGTDPVPAGVAISAVTASLALALLAKVLAINRRRGDAARIDPLLEWARRESVRLVELADADIRAFNRYMDCRRRKEATDDAMQEAIRTPMDAARATWRGLELCQEAEAHCETGMTASDFGVARSLLSGALRAMLLTVESNLVQLPQGDPFRLEISAELPRLKLRAS